MTEKEKMLKGLSYNSEDEELIADRNAARDYIYDFNNSRPSEQGARYTIIERLFAKIGNRILIEPPFHCDYGYNIEVGDNFYANFNCVILDVCKVTIGENVLFGPGVQVYTASHPVDPQERLTLRESGSPVVIGDNVWLGGGVILCPGVTIGSNTTIGAGSVVVKDIPANVVAAGNPCKVIRSL